MRQVYVLRQALNSVHFVLKVATHLNDKRRFVVLDQLEEAEGRRSRGLGIGARRSIHAHLQPSNHAVRVKLATVARSRRFPADALSASRYLFRWMQSMLFVRQVGRMGRGACRHVFITFKSVVANGYGFRA